MEERPFSNDWLLMLEINDIKNKYGVKTFIETGTWKGNTALILSTLFEKVYTVEINKDFYDEASFLDKRGNIVRAFGDSSKFLSKFGDTYWDKKPVMIFLDAHSFGYGCSLHAELDSLIENKMNNAILIVHDCLVPDNDNLGYDIYNETPISYNYIKSKLDILYNNNYSYYYNTKSMGEQRGILFIIPRGIK